MCIVHWMVHQLLSTPMWPLIYYCPFYLHICIEQIEWGPLVIATHFMNSKPFWVGSVDGVVRPWPDEWEQKADRTCVFLKIEKCNVLIAMTSRLCETIATVNLWKSWSSHWLFGLWCLVQRKTFKLIMDYEWEYAMHCDCERGAVLFIN